MARTKLSIPVESPSEESFTRFLSQLGIPIARNTQQLREYLPALLLDLTHNYLDQLEVQDALVPPSDAGDSPWRHPVPTPFASTMRSSGTEASSQTTFSLVDLAEPREGAGTGLLVGASLSREWVRISDIDQDEADEEQLEPQKVQVDLEMKGQELEEEDESVERTRDDHISITGSGAGEAVRAAAVLEGLDPQDGISAHVEMLEEIQGGGEDGGGHAGKAMEVDPFPPCADESDLSSLPECLSDVNEAVEQPEAAASEAARSTRLNTILATSLHRLPSPPSPIVRHSPRSSVPSRPNQPFSPRTSTRASLHASPFSPPSSFSNSYPPRPSRSPQTPPLTSSNLTELQNSLSPSPAPSPSTSVSLSDAPTSGMVEKERTLILRTSTTSLLRKMSALIPFPILDEGDGSGERKGEGEGEEKGREEVTGKRAKMVHWEKGWSSTSELSELSSLTESESGSEQEEEERERERERDEERMRKDGKRRKRNFEIIVWSKGRKDKEKVFHPETKMGEGEGVGVGNEG